MRLFCVALLLATFACSRSDSSNNPARAVPSQNVQTSSTSGTTSTETARASNTPATAPAAESNPICEAAPNRLCPSDEGPSDPSFAAFRREFRDAVTRRDQTKLVAMIDPKVRTSFGAQNGTADLNRQLARADSALWRELEASLQLGGDFRGEGSSRMFWAPYAYASWPESIDTFSHVAATGPEVVLRAAPNATAPQVTRVAWEILELLPDPSDAPGARWRRVRTTSGKEGWVQRQDIRSPIDYRAGFNKRTGQWKLEAFVKGD